MISHPAGMPRSEHAWYDRGVDAKPESVESHEMGDVDAELGVTAQVPGVQVVEVNVQQAQGLSRFRAHRFFSEQRMN